MIRMRWAMGGTGIVLMGIAAAERAAGGLDDAARPAPIHASAQADGLRVRVHPLVGAPQASGIPSVYSPRVRSSFDADRFLRTVSAREPAASMMLSAGDSAGTNGLGEAMDPSSMRQTTAAPREAERPARPRRPRGRCKKSVVSALFVDSLLCGDHGYIFPGLIDGQCPAVACVVSPGPSMTPLGPLF